MEEIFESEVNSSETFAGVFEFDGEAGYFYLYQMNETEGNKILDSIHIISGKPLFTENDIAIRWDSSENFVCLFIKGLMWAIFSCQNNEKFGGNYSVNNLPNIPQKIKDLFV